MSWVDHCALHLHTYRVKPPEGTQKVCSRDTAAPVPLLHSARGYRAVRLSSCLDLWEFCAMIIQKFSKQKGVFSTSMTLEIPVQGRGDKSRAVV